MMRLLGCALGVLALALVSCTASKSTTCCDEACRIWAACGWDYDACMGECAAEGDWCGSYIDCIRGRSCEELIACE